MQAAIIVFPGSNCERDCAVALLRSTGKDPLMVWHGETSLPKLDLIVLPGGFSHGDYLRTGAMAAHSPIMQEVVKQAKQGTRVFGICNGFQILCEAGLLPGILLRNASLKYVCRMVTMEVERNDNDFTRTLQKGQQIKMPVGHGDGNFFADAETLKKIEANGQVLLRYQDNPNGSANNIAGVTNEAGNVFGMMPHPDRACDPIHASTDGKSLFDSIARTFA